MRCLQLSHDLVQVLQRLLGQDEALLKAAADLFRPLADGDKMRGGLCLFGNDAVEFLEQVEDLDRIGFVLLKQGIDAS